MKLSFNLSLRKKLFLLIGFMIAAQIIGMLVAKYIIQKVQIGGKSYTGIEQKAEYIDLLARTRLNINLNNGILRTQLIEYDDEMSGVVLRTNKRLTELFSSMLSFLPETSDISANNCGSCHQPESTATLMENIKNASKQWRSMQKIIENQLLPTLEDEDTDEAQDIFDEAYSDHFLGIMQHTKKAVDFIREASDLMKTTTKSEVSSFITLYFIMGLVTIVIAVLAAFLLVRHIINTVNTISSELNETADLIKNESENTSSSSHSLAEMASEISASLEESSASLEQITSMVQQNDENSSEAQALMEQANQVGKRANEEMAEMMTSMNNIKEDSDRIATIINEIESIAFQTNLLALNAAVEAARAGEHGQGFAVVADEVRSLAQRTAESAGNSHELLDRALTSVQDGLRQAESLARELQEVTENSSKSGLLVGEISTSSHEQAEGIRQINIGVREMDTSTQQMAANSDNLASASESLFTQTIMLRENIDKLVQLVQGKHTNLNNADDIEALPHQPE